jgi:hypothetical protein
VQQVVVISYRHFVTNYWSQNLVKNHYSLRNNPEEVIPHLRGGSLKSHIKIIVVMGEFCVWLEDKVIVYE